MSYNIAIGSTDGVNVDKHFGSAKSLLILRVNDDETYETLGERSLEEKDIGSNTCSSAGGCGNSCGHNDEKLQSKIEIISDCRCLICSQCGPGAEKQLGKKDISTFVVDINVDESVKKIIRYYKRFDEHKHLK